MHVSMQGAETQWMTRGPEENAYGKDFMFHTSERIVVRAGVSYSESTGDQHKGI